MTSFWVNYVLGGVLNISTALVGLFWTCALTSEAGAGVAVPVVTAVAVDRTGVGAAGVWHTAAWLHVQLPGLRQTQSTADPQTLHPNHHTTQEMLIIH